jgi:hypothetical protein
VGVFTFSLLLFQALRSSLWLRRNAQSSIQSEFAVFMVSALVAYVVAGMGLHIIRNVDFISKYFFCFMGILSGMLDALRGPERTTSYSTARVEAQGQMSASAVGL